MTTQPDISASVAYMHSGSALTIKRAKPKTTQLPIYSSYAYSQKHPIRRHYIVSFFLFTAFTATALIPTLETIQEQQKKILTLSGQTYTLQNEIKSLQQLLLEAKSKQPILKHPKKTKPTPVLKKKNELSSNTKKFFISNIPIGYPLHGEIVSSFGYRKHPLTKNVRLHKGIDIVATIGTKVKTTAEGKVLKAQWEDDYGLMIEIEHFGEFTTKYAHLSELKVSPGDYVTKGTLIGLSGNTGISTGPHLHYEVRMRNKLLDPICFTSCSKSTIHKLIEKEKNIQWDSLIAKMTYQQNIKIVHRSLPKGSNLKENG